MIKKCCLQANVPATDFVQITFCLNGLFFLKSFILLWGFPYLFYF